MNHDRFGSISFAPAVDFTLAAKVAALARARNPGTHGGVYTSDKFYDDWNDVKIRMMHDYGVLAADMRPAWCACTDHHDGQRLVCYA